MIKFAEKHYREDIDFSISRYNYHPGIFFLYPEQMVKLLGWKRCKDIVLENIKLGCSSKMNIYTETRQGYRELDFFAEDLQHLLSFYYEDIPKIIL